jgi:hypothetical protein
VKMNNIKLTTSILAIVILFSGCKSNDIAKNIKEQRIPTKVSLMTYNSLASAYMERPTFATLYTYKDESYIRVEAKTYGTEHVKYLGTIDKKMLVRISSTQTRDFINAIDKYLKWNDLAIKNKDIVEKTISQTETIQFMKLFDSYTKFGFYSGSATSHYLTITNCTIASLIPDMCIDSYIDKKNALNLKELILAYQNGDISSTVKGEYN